MWADGYPEGAHVGNIGNDLVLPLVVTEEAVANEPDVPNLDEFVIERVIGQFMLRSFLTGGANTLVHERLYVTPTFDGSTIALRDLESSTEADTSFMYHNVWLYHASHFQDAVSHWGDRSNTGTLPQNVAMHGPCFRDIKVGRRVKEGECLCLHWQFAASGGGVYEDDIWQCYPWFRVLLRKSHG